MVRALELHFSPRAGADIDDIFDYTEAEWGSDQAENYTIELKNACNRLIETPRLGRWASSIRSGYFVLNCGSHNIFYRIAQDRIVVVRILHQRMDASRHLK